MKLHFKRMYSHSCAIRLLTRNGCNKLGNCDCFTLIIFISPSIFLKDIPALLCEIDQSICDAT